MKTGVGAKEFKGDNGVVKVVVLPDEEIECDMVVVSIGVRANTQITKAAGIHCERGIVVDERMTTSAKVLGCG